MAVGSSGGHIYPAFAVAESLKDLFLKQCPKESSLEIHFVHSGSQLGNQLLSSGSYPVHKVSIGGLAVGQSFVRKIKTLFQLPIAFFKSALLIKKIKADLIFGTGGSLTFPVLMAGFLMKKKIAIWEGNTSLGLANKVLTSFVSQVFTVFPQVKGLSPKKQIWSAYPLRKQIQKPQTQDKRDQSSLSLVGVRDIAHPSHTTPHPSKTPHSRESGNLSLPEENLNKNSLQTENKFKVLVLGGSQGSVFLNQAVSQAVEEAGWRKDIFIYHQTGDKSFKKLSQKYKSVEGVFAFAFSKDIQTYYQDCDLIFSRAGSGSVAELAHCEKAAVLIPLTYSAGGHQLQNANWLVSQNCVQMIQEKNFNAKAFKNRILELKEDTVRRKQMAQNLKSVYQSEDEISPWLLSKIMS